MDSTPAIDSTLLCYFFGALFTFWLPCVVVIPWFYKKNKCCFEIKATTTMRWLIVLNIIISNNNIRPYIDYIIILLMFDILCSWIIIKSKCEKIQISYHQIYYKIYIFLFVIFIYLWLSMVLFFFGINYFGDKYTYIHTFIHSFTKKKIQRFYDFLGGNS